jgi:radical SAM/Cys-rich protein
VSSFKDWVRQYGYEITKGPVRCLQVNVGYRCNLECVHCHIEAGPQRQECMGWTVMADILHFIDTAQVAEIDITGGAPEMNPDLIKFITELRQRNFIKRILLRTNLAIYEDEGYRHLPEVLYGLNVELVASMPCYLEENIDQQRGKGVFRKNIAVLRRLNQIGFGTGTSGRKLHLVYNPGGAHLPGAQEQLEKAYKEHMSAAYGITFDQLYTIANMPLGRFSKQLQARDMLDDYIELLKCSSDAANLSGVMCRYTVSVDWRGFIFDCDFNQALNRPAIVRDAYIGRINQQDLTGIPVVTGEHCFGCTAGQGSSCRGSLVSQSA